MSKVLFIMDIEEGHILPSFALARSLQERGHEVVYLTIPDNEDVVREQGFDYYPIFQKAYPKGFRHAYKRKQLALERQAGESYNYLDEIVDGIFDRIMEELQADLFIVSDFLRIDILILYHHFRIVPVVFTPFLRDNGATLAADCTADLLKIPGGQSFKLIEFFARCGLHFHSLEQLTAPLDKLPDLIACPSELLIGAPPKKAGRVYMGPSIRPGAGMHREPYYKDIRGGDKIIYASMGSQAIGYKQPCLHFFNLVIQMMRQDDMQGMQLVLSIGGEFEVEDLPPLPANVIAVKWVSQVDILAVSVLAIIHGGLGTVKECIYFGVPMVVLPLTRDQPSNAKRVEYHRLGVAVNVNALTEQTLSSCVHSVLESTEIKENMAYMKNIFRNAELNHEGVTAIEAMLAVPGFKKESV